MNSENEIFIAFDSADVLALSRLTKLMQQISNSSNIRQGDAFKSAYASGYLDAKDSKVDLSPDHIVKRKSQIIAGSIVSARNALNKDK